jgi:phenylalanyl-tRNA synthetase beta chain
MKFSLNWLNEYIDLQLAPEVIAQTLTQAGLEVDGIETSETGHIFEVSLTPNLGHCANMIGIARELSAATGSPVRLPPITLNESLKNPVATAVKATVKAPEGCPRYACRLIHNVKVVPSPQWLQEHLLSAGVRPINSIVDVVNYVTLEMGQPMHAYDYEQLEGKEIVVRMAMDNELFTTLDGQEHLLNTQDLVICDAKKPIALAGIMGGKNSEVGESTRTVLLEAAYFHPSMLRKTSKRLGFSTDASKRFERGCDPNQVLQALNRTAMLIQQISNGDIAAGVIDIQANPFPEKVIECRLSRVNRLLGVHLGASEMENIFQRLGMPSCWKGQDILTVTVPTYRGDITAEVDLIEEVARIYGYAHIQKTPARYHASKIPSTPIFYFEREVRSQLIAAGLQEFLTCDLIGPSICAIVQDDVVPPAFIVNILNPTSIEQSLLRTSLLPGLLQTIKHNFDHQNHDIAGFEIGRTHFKQVEGYKEQPVVALILTGKRAPHYWGEASQEVDFFELKGMIENLLAELKISNVTFQHNHYSTLHTGRQASIFVDKLEIGSFGEVHPAIQRRLDVPQRIFFAELSLQDLMQVRTRGHKMLPLPIYPGSERDWTITVKEELPVQQLLDAARAVRAPLLQEVSLQDIYRSDKLGLAVKNVTLHFVYRDPKKTVEQAVVDGQHAFVTEEILKSIN